MRTKKIIPETPKDFGLRVKFYNPFSPTTTVRYSLPGRSYVRLIVLNEIGQQVAALVDEEKDAGRYEVKFDVTTLSTGVYFYRLVAGGYMATKRLFLLN